MVFLRSLIAIGTAILLFYLAMFAVMFYHMTREPVVDRDAPEVKQVMDWLGAVDDEVELLNSYHPTGNWSGDYETLFVLRLPAETIHHVTEKPGVVRGDQADDDVQALVSFLSTFTRDQPWFPTQAMMGSKECYLVPLASEVRSGLLDAGTLIVLEPDAHRVYFAAAKM